MTGGIPCTSFAVQGVHAELVRLRDMGVHLTQEPLEMGPATTAVLDDTCGNLVHWPAPRADGALAAHGAFTRRRVALRGRSDLRP